MARGVILRSAGPRVPPSYTITTVRCSEIAMARSSKPAGGSITYVRASSAVSGGDSRNRSSTVRSHSMRPARCVNNSITSRESDNARWSSDFAKPKCTTRSSSRQLGAPRTQVRARSSVSMTGFEGSAKPVLAAAKFRNPKSKVALWASRIAVGPAEEIQESRQGLRQRRLPPDHRVRDAVDVRHVRRDQALRIDQLLPGAQFAAVEPKPDGTELHDPVDDGKQAGRLQVEGDEFDVRQWPVMGKHGMAHGGAAVTAESTCLPLRTSHHSLLPSTASREIDRIFVDARVSPPRPVM